MLKISNDLVKNEKGSNQTHHNASKGIVDSVVDTADQTFLRELQIFVKVKRLRIFHQNDFGLLRVLDHRMLCFETSINLSFQNDK